MSNLIDIQETGDFVYTMDHGRLRAWEVLADGTLAERDPAEVIGQ